MIHAVTSIDLSVMFCSSQRRGYFVSYGAFMINDVIRVQRELSGISNYVGMKEGLLYVMRFFAHLFVASGINLRISPHLPSFTSGNDCLLR